MLLRVHFWCDTFKKPAFLQPLPLLCSAAVMYEKACTIALNKIISTRTEWTVRYFTSEMAEFWFVCRSKPICVKPWIYVSMTSKTLHTISKCCPTRIPSSNASWLEDMTLAKEIQEQKGSLDNKTHGFSFTFEKCEFKLIKQFVNSLNIRGTCMGVASREATKRLCVISSNCKTVIACGLTNGKKFYFSEDLSWCLLRKNFRWSYR